MGGNRERVLKLCYPGGGAVVLLNAPLRIRREYNSYELL